MAVNGMKGRTPFGESLLRADIDLPSEELPEEGIYSAIALMSFSVGADGPLAVVRTDGSASIDWLRTRRAAPRAIDLSSNSFGAAICVARLLVKALEDGQEAGKLLGFAAGQTAAVSVSALVERCRFAAREKNLENDKAFIRKVLVSALDLALNDSFKQSETPT